MFPVSIVGTWLSLSFSFCFFILFWFGLCHLFLNSLGLIQYITSWFVLIQFSCQGQVILPELTCFTLVASLVALYGIDAPTLGPHPQLFDSAHVRGHNTVPQYCYYTINATRRSSNEYSNKSHMLEFTHFPRRLCLFQS